MRTKYITAFILSVMSLLTFNACKSKDTPAEEIKISIFCDHIKSIAEQEGISFREAAAKVREMGYNGVDIDVRIKPEELAALNELGFQYPCAIAQIAFTKQDFANQVTKAIAFLKENNIKNVLLVPGLFGKEDAPERKYDALIERTEDFAAKAEAIGCKVLLEDYDNSFSPCYNIAALDRYFEKVPSLGHVFDSGNYMFAGEDALEALKHFRSRIGHVHLKDRKGAGNMGCPAVGSGIIPISEIVKELRSSGYEGWFTIEHYGSGQMLQDAETSISFFKGI